MERGRGAEPEQNRSRTGAETIRKKKPTEGAAAAAALATLARRRGTREGKARGAKPPPPPPPTHPTRDGLTIYRQGGSDEKKRPRNK